MDEVGDDMGMSGCALRPDWWLYILRCGDGTLYTGITTDVEARLAKHQDGKGAKYTRGRGSLMVAYRELVGSKGEATKREMAVKKMARGAKDLLIAAYSRKQGKSKRHCNVIAAEAA